MNMEVLLWSIGEYTCTERDKGLGVGFLKLERAVGIFCSCAGEREFFYMDNSVSLSVGIFLMIRQRPFHLTEYLFNSSPPIQVVPNSCPLE